ncbi:ribonucleotide reductase subunit alpha [Neptunomonas concharum]|uniref:Ribonucleotide reductase subunit alpha n=1 Tax=Neptunomonas concharum TaxID=1031538 RepID=A0A5P1RD63_9GAMM|nr:ribonucleotide reductase subunit alpha [Neptunomonas concharum]QEQ97543.1 ribonucleotide reductase subunit alpha [Neptunomonas concharum]
MSGEFSKLIEAAKQQEQPQRLLMLFAKAEGNKKKGKNAVNETGTVTPLMCVDKLPEELRSFDALIKEADGISEDWNFVLIAGLGGSDGVAPPTEAAEPYLNQMANDVMMGQDLTGYTILDRQQNPVLLQAR